MEFKRGQLVTIPEWELSDGRGKGGWKARKDQPKIMTVCDGYAMVRFKGAMPFCVAVTTLKKWNND